MKMNFRKLVLAVLLACFASPALGADENGRYTVLGSGINSCGKWTEARKEKALDGIIDTSWVNGYLTAYNIYTPGINDITKNIDLEGWAAWIDNYCISNPLNNITNASFALVHFLKNR